MWLTYCTGKKGRGDTKGERKRETAREREGDRPIDKETEASTYRDRDERESMIIILHISPTSPKLQIPAAVMEQWSLQIIMPFLA